MPYLVRRRLFRKDVVNNNAVQVLVPEVYYFGFLAVYLYGVFPHDLGLCSPAFAGCPQEAVSPHFPCAMKRIPGLHVKMHVGLTLGQIDQCPQRTPAPQTRSEEHTSEL